MSAISWLRPRLRKRFIEVALEPFLKLRNGEFFGMIGRTLAMADNEQVEAKDFYKWKSYYEQHPAQLNEDINAIRSYHPPETEDSLDSRILLRRVQFNLSVESQLAPDYLNEFRWIEDYVKVIRDDMTLADNDADWIEEFRQTMEEMIGRMEGPVFDDYATYLVKQYGTKARSRQLGISVYPTAEDFFCLRNVIPIRILNNIVSIMNQACIHVLSGYDLKRMSNELGLVLKEKIARDLELSHRMIERAVNGMLGSTDQDKEIVRSKLVAEAARHSQDNSYGDIIKERIVFERFEGLVGELTQYLAYVREILRTGKADVWPGIQIERL